MCSEKEMEIMWQSEIDFVVLWVDGNDPDWRAKRHRYQVGDGTDTSVARYREWDNLIYWFRAVEKFASWVRKIHFVSDKQIPQWLSVDHPKLHIVSHSDYMPSSALPVFNSSAIEIGLHRIPDLSDHFVFFNDDMFLLKPIKPEYFFTNGVPNDMAGMTRACSRGENNVFSNILCNDYDIINKYFNRRETIKINFSKWYSVQYGKTFFRSLLHSGRSSFDGIVIPHLSTPYVKSDWETVWEYEGKTLRETQNHRFRQNEDINHFIFRFWRLCQGNFNPKRSLGKYFNLCDSKSVQKICYAIRKQIYPEICINDNWKEEDNTKAKEDICAAFSEILGVKSSFEK